MDDDFIGGGILITSEAELDEFFDEKTGSAFDLSMLPGHNIKTGCYGLFLVALDQCDDPGDKAILEQATTALDSIEECLVSCSMTLYYREVKIDYAGILKLADVMIFLSDELPGKHVGQLSESTMVHVDQQISEMLDITQEAAAASLFGALGFNPLEVEIAYDGSRQLEFDFR